MSTDYVTRPDGVKLVYCYTPAAAGKTAPLVMFCGGFRSDMQGTKALYLEARCRARGQAYLRFDYSGHGLSGGRFEDGTIGRWKDDAAAVLSEALRRGAPEDTVLAGSSMGGWIALLLALERPDLIRGLVGIAAAPDFTKWIYRDLSATQRRELEEKGFAAVPNDYSDEPYIFTRALIEDGCSYKLLGKTNRTDFPIRLIQGKQDSDVPWETALQIRESFKGTDVTIDFIEDGDHRLSRPQDLDRIDEAVRALSGL